jgi:hypothetical protein
MWVNENYEKFINEKETDLFLMMSAKKYLLACCRHVELNPLRAGMVEDPSQYRWSSCPVKTGIKEHPWLNLDPFLFEP